MAWNPAAWLRSFRTQTGAPGGMADYQRSRTSLDYLRPTDLPDASHVRIPWRRPPRVWQGTNRAAQTGQPEPMGSPDHRPPSQVQHPIPFGAPIYRLTPRNDRGSDKFSYDSGRITSNPIGAGVPYFDQLPVFQSMVGQVVPNQGILWRSQVGGVSGPRMHGIYSASALQMMLGPTLAAAVVETPNAPRL